MICNGCGREAHDWYGDAWCDHCGGVMSRPGVLIFRHVATVSGDGGRIPIVWDETTGDYKVRVPLVGHPEVKAKRHIDHFDFRPGRRAFLTKHGSLDGVLTVVLPLARGGGEEIELSAAPTSTEVERSLLRL